MDLRLLLNHDEPVHDDVEMIDEAPIVQQKLRSGKWTRQEEEYAATLIKYFVEGALDIPAGISLRYLLASKLHCSLVRVSDKLTHGTLGSTPIAKKLGLLRYFPSKTVSDEYRRDVMHELSQHDVAFRQTEGLSTSTDLISPAVSCQSDSDGDSDGDPVRVGSWSLEEERYARALIDAFLNGLVDLTEGASLRGFLANRLRCSPMRVSKKLAKGKLAGSIIPKRLGSALYKHQPHVQKWEIDRKELQLGQLYRDCFTSTPQKVLEKETHVHQRDSQYPLGRWSAKAEYTLPSVYLPSISACRFRSYEEEYAPRRAWTTGHAYPSY